MCICIPIQQASRRYLRFLHQGIIWQFRALPFGLNTAPRVFTKVTAPFARDFMTQQAQPTWSWQRLLGHLVSLEKLVPYKQQLSMKWNQSGSPVHYGLHRRENEGVPGLVVKYLEPREGHSHRCTQDTVYLYTDSSSMGWGAHVAQHTASGTWKGPDKELNRRASG